MISILVVEDDAKKLQAVMKCLLSIDGVDESKIKHVMDILSAKREMSKTSFDLLILDIAIPERMDQPIKPDGGLKLLEVFDRPGRLNIPDHIIGVTAVEEVRQLALERFSQRLWALLFFDWAIDAWSSPLAARVRHILAVKENQSARLPEHKHELAIVCALDTPELSAVLKLDWGWEQFHSVGDDTIYYRGTYKSGSGQQRTVVAASAPRFGIAASAALSMKLVQVFRPRYLAMVGITAGVRRKVRIGDIIAADPSWDWGSGKWVREKGALRFLPAPHQLAIDPAIRNKLKLIMGDEAALSEIRSKWEGEKPSHALGFHIGPVASGASVLADGQICKDVIAQHRSLLGIEMEVYGVYAAVEEASLPRPKVFALKAVTDFADGTKNDKFRWYAAYASANAMRIFVERFLD